MDKLKPEEVKIISISSNTIKNGEQEKIYGLGDDNIIYSWDTGSGKWYKYSIQ